MKLMMVGVNHKLLNIDERRKFYFTESDKLAFSSRLSPITNQVLILSTCNRSEVYIVSDDLFAENILKEEYLSYFHQTNVNVELLSEKQAMEHLLSVVCGIESMVIGEDQIVHQVKLALDWTMKYHFSGKELNYIFQTAIQFAKSMRNTYTISEHPLSLSYIGFLSLKPYLNQNKKIMICGIGEIAQLMIKYLAKENLYLVNRTYEKVLPFMNQNRTYVPFHKRYQYLQSMDIVISATSSPHYVFEDRLIDVDHPMIFLDLALPRDIDVFLKKRKNVTFLDLDDLQNISSHYLQQRLEISYKIKEEIQQETEVILKALTLMKSDNVIAQMQKKYLDISNDTYELLKNKLHLNRKEEYILKKVLQTSFLRLMRDPIRLLKNDDPQLQQQYIELLEKMMDIKENDE